MLAFCKFGNEIFGFLKTQDIFNRLSDSQFSKVVPSLGKEFSCPLTGYSGAGIAQSVQQLAAGWMVLGSNPGEGEIFHICPDRPWGPPSLMYNGYRVFNGGKADGEWC